MDFKKIKLTTLVTFLLFSFLLVEISLAGPSVEIMDGFSKTGKEAGYYVTDGGTPEKTFSQAWAEYTDNFASGAGGAFFMVLAIYGGWLWMTAQGKEEQVEKAKKIIIGASIGLGVIIGALIITKLIIKYLGVAIGLS